MAQHRIGIDVFETHHGNMLLDRVFEQAARSPYGAVCALSTGTPHEVLRLEHWFGVPDGERAVLAPHNDGLGDNLIELATGISALMWGTGRTFFLFDAAGWGIALFDDRPRWAKPPERILPHMGVVLAPKAPDSAHARMAQEMALARVSERLALFEDTLTSALGTPPPPLVIDRAISTI